MRGALERHGGTVEKFIGDAVMAVFGLPVRHEDDAVRAIRAAADMQTALDAPEPGVPDRATALELSNHIGVNSGEVIAGDASTAQRMVTGDAVNTAARLEQAAGSGEVVLGDLTYRLARDQIEVEFMAPLDLKGKAEPVPGLPPRARQRPQAAAGAQPRDAVRRPRGGDGAARRRRSTTRSTSRGARLVDRRRRRRRRQVAADPRVRRRRPTEQARLVRGRCLPYGDGITFWPLAEVVREAAGITNEDSPARRDPAHRPAAGARAAPRIARRSSSASRPRST